MAQPQYHAFSDYDQQAQTIAKRRALAEAMLAEANAPLQGQQAGRLFVAPSWTQALAKLGQGWAANRQIEAQEKAGADLATRRRENLARTMAEFNGQMAGKPAQTIGDEFGATTFPGSAPDRDKAMAALMANPDTAGIALQQSLANAFKQDAPVKLGPGDILWQGGKTLAQAPFKPDAPEKLPWYVTKGSDGKTVIDPAYADFERMKAKEGRAPAPYFQAVPTDQGIMTFNTRSGQFAPGVSGEGASLVKSSDSPSLQGAIAEAKAAGREVVKRGSEAKDASAKLPILFDPLDRMAATAKEVMNSKGLDARTGLTSYMPDWSQGEEARNTQAQMDTLKSQIAQNVLQMYRNMSHTGGAVGQVSDFEQRVFMDNLAALKQSQGTKQFKNELDRIINFAEGSKARLKAAYEKQYGVAADVGGAPPAPARAITRTGTLNGRRVVEYSDGTVEYADK